MTMKSIVLTLLLLAATVLPSQAGPNPILGNQEFCPVMGFEINRDIFTDYMSKRIYFCCSSCPSEFKGSPDKFMTQMRDNGVILQDSPA